MENITSISIDGQRLPNFQHELNEHIGNHSTFVIAIDIAELETQGAHTLDASKTFLVNP